MVGFHLCKDLPQARSFLLTPLLGVVQFLLQRLHFQFVVSIDKLFVVVRSLLKKKETV